MEERDDYPTIPQPSKDKDRAINNNKEFLNWIYERMICVHGEKDMYDYMINFKSIIDSQEELASLKEVVKDLLPLAQEVFDSITIDDAETHREYISLKALLDRAKTLLR